MMQPQACLQADMAVGAPRHFERRRSGVVRAKLPGGARAGPCLALPGCANVEHGPLPPGSSCSCSLRELVGWVTVSA